MCAFHSTHKIPEISVDTKHETDHFGLVRPEVPLFCILLTRTKTKRAVARVGSEQPESQDRSIGHVECPKFP